MKCLIPILFVLSFVCCKEDKEESSVNLKIIENEIFNATILIDGHDFDDTIIRNCTFENIAGDGLQIRDVHNLIIENNVFRNISEDAIRFRNSGISDGVSIINNQIYNIEENGILAPENHTNTLIKGNTIYNVATNNLASQAGSPHHGIYFQGIDVEITENIIYDVINDQGNCISIRTSGIISGNILFGATDHGISYYSDHPGNSGLLLIENNFIYDNGKRGINLASNGVKSNHIGEADIRFNTIISNSKSPLAMNDELTGVTFNISGNIAIRTDGGSTYVFTNLPFNSVKNLTGIGDIGFINFSARDLHLTDNSEAENYASGLTNFPSLDIDGENRQSSGLDAGADER